MIRTQIYLSEYEYEALKQLKNDTGKSHSALIRFAIDCFIKSSNFEKDAKQSFGMWRDHNINFDYTRDSWDRSYE